MYSLLHGVPHCTVTQASLPTYSHFVFPMDSIRSGVVRKKIGGGDFLATLMATHLPAFGGPPCLLAPFSVSLCWTSVHSEFGLVADDALEGVGHGLRSVGRGSPSPAAAVAQTAGRCLFKDTLSNSTEPLLRFARSASAHDCPSSQVPSLFLQTCKSLKPGRNI